MIKNYFTIAIRNLLKHKLFTTLNIFGLSLSMSICLVLILLVYDHYQYDKFHKNPENTYRIISFYTGEDGTFDDVYATSPAPFKNSLKDQYSFIEEISNLNSRFNGEIRSEHKILNINSLYADNSFFQIFGFEMAEGDARTALSEPMNIVLTADLAEKLFPKESALGKTVEFEDHGSYVVSGVLKPNSENTHIKFEALASFSSLDLLADKKIVNASHNDWKHVWSNYNYLILRNESDREKANKVINEIAAENIKLEADHPGYTFRLQSLSEIVPGRPMANEIGFTLPWFVLSFFGLLGLVVLITASINYTNLSMAKSLSRAKEIGIRKVNGASKKQIVAQFLVESVLTATLSLFISIIIYRYLLVMFNEIWIFNMVGISLTDNIGTYGYFFLFTLIIGLFTGIGPAVFLSRLKTINTLKGSAINMSRRRRSLISSLFGKKTLISIQFSLSILMLVTILVIDKQADYLVNAHYGFNDTEVFYINGQGHDSDLLKQEFGSMAGVEKVTFASHHPAVGRSHGDEAYWDPEKEPITLYHFSVDPSYVDVMDLKVIAGRDFPEDMLTKNEKFVLINEKAVETLGFGSQSEAIGEIVIMDSLNFIVVGVLQDYHWEPLTNSIRPLALRVNTDKTEFIYLKVKSDNMIAERKKFQEAWTNFDPGRDFDGGLLSDKLDEFYQFFYDLGSILTYVALIALSITSLGFLGMVSFELKTKVKEIGIRKVLGATFQSLIMSMSKGFIVMIALTSFLAIPLGVWLNNLWVQKIAFHQPVDSSIVINTIIIVLIIAGVTIISQLWINANKNPTETLRSE